MKPLYLQARPGMQIDYEEPALRVSLPKQTRQLFSLLRVSRIVVSGAVQWSMEALLACADAGIAIVFLNDDGQVRARWLGCDCQRQVLLQGVLELLQRGDSMERYQDWLRGMQRMAVRSSARRLRLVDWREADANELKAWLEYTRRADWSGTEIRLQSLLMSTVLMFLGNYGLDARNSGLLQGQLHLPEDLCALLLWDFYPALYAWQKKHPAAPGQRDLIRFYEARSQRVEQLLRGIVAKLHQWLLALG